MNDRTLVHATMRRYVEALLDGDWDALAGTLAEDHVLDDRRVGMRSTFDKAGSVEQARVLAALATDQQTYGGADEPFRIDVDFIETRGERLALVRQVYRAAGLAVAILGVMEVNANAQTVAFIAFDEDNLDAARTELERRGR